MRSQKLKIRSFVKMPDFLVCVLWERKVYFKRYNIVPLKNAASFPFGNSQIYECAFAHECSTESAIFLKMKLRFFRMRFYCG